MGEDKGLLSFYLVGRVENVFLPCVSSREDVKVEG